VESAEVRMFPVEEKTMAGAERMLGLKETESLAKVSAWQELAMKAEWEWAMELQSLSESLLEKLTQLES
jgi:hypothetical protein